MARIAKKKAAFGTSMGVSSIIAILVILVLVVFSTLSITTSKADLTLSEKSSESIKAYYEADSLAENMVAEVAVTIRNGGSWRADLLEKGYNISMDDHGIYVSYTVPIDVNRNLDVELFIDNSDAVIRELWQVVPAREWVPENDISLFQP